MSGGEGVFFSAVTAAELTRLQVLCKRKIRAHTALKLQVFNILNTPTAVFLNRLVNQGEKEH